MLRIVNSDFTLLGEIRQLKQVKFVHKWHEVSTCTFQVHESVKYVSSLEDDTTIMFFNDGALAFIITDKKYIAKTGFWEFTALSAGALLLRRITVPPVGQDTDKYTTEPVETIMKGIVSANAITATDANRNIPNLVTAADTGRGPVITFETRYKNLAEELASLSRSTGEGWGISLDLTAQQYVFDMYEGRDLAYNESGAPYVVFSQEFKNIENQEYNSALSNYKNYAYSGGQGEGAARAVIQVGSAAGRDRREVFIDARDLSDDTLLDERAADKLNTDYAAIESFECDVIQSGRFIYGRDYKLGDIVSVQNRQIGKTLDARIVEVEETFEGSQRTVKPVFDNNVPTVFQIIKRELINLKGQVKS